jgi:hypothetical protein
MKTTSILFSFICSLLLILFSCGDKDLEEHKHSFNFISPSEFNLSNTQYYAGDSIKIVYSYTSNRKIKTIDVSFIQIDKATNERKLHHFDSYLINDFDTEIEIGWKIPDLPTPPNHAEIIEFQISMKGANGSMFRGFKPFIAGE